MRPLESEDAKFIYYHKRSTADDTFPCVDIWRMPVAGGDESLILEGLAAANYSLAGGFVFSTWKLGKNGIYFMNSKTEPNDSIEFFNFATREKNLVATPKATSNLFCFALSPDEKQILYSHTERVHGDIMLVENFR